MRIIVDLDETIVDMMTPLLDIYNEKYDDAKTIDDIKVWELPKEMIDIFRYTEYFFLKLEPYPHALYGVRHLKKMGHDIVIATAPSHSGHIARQKITWINEMLPDFKNDIVLTHRKDIFNAEIIIDDHVDHVDSFNGTRILVDKPWNRYYKPDYRVMNIESTGWHDIVRRIAIHTVHPRTYCEGGL
jgi:5'(3')-deoxyribonucleotidase